MALLHSPATEAYDSLAPYYESLTHDYAHPRWLVRLEELARCHGLGGRRVLDVACGTGKSMRPLLDLGYVAVGCDVSPRMLDVARRRVPGVRLVAADMRALPDLGLYSWITCLNDAVNYLLEDADLPHALTSMAQGLEPDGVLTFDVNTLSAHNRLFDDSFAVERPEALLCWRGAGRSGVRGELGTTEITIFSRHGAAWSRTLSRHRQRWWSDSEIQAAADAAGLAVVGRYGQRQGAVVDPEFDERYHSKLVYFLRRRGQ